eukprot:COSAG06_NODE_8710_length_2091_cov_1.474398_2_plen_224_part_00
MSETAAARRVAGGLLRRRRGGWQEAAAAAAAVARSGLGREDSACLRCGDLQSDQASLVAAEHKVHAYRGPAEQVDCGSGSSSSKSVDRKRFQSLDATPAEPRTSDSQAVPSQLPTRISRPIVEWKRTARPHDFVGAAWPTGPRRLARSPLARAWTTPRPPTPRWTPAIRCASSGADFCCPPQQPARAAIDSFTSTATPWGSSPRAQRTPSAMPWVTGPCSPRA